jgi:hypothetical protein
VDIANHEDEDDDTKEGVRPGIKKLKKRNNVGPATKEDLLVFYSIIIIMCLHPAPYLTDYWNKSRYNYNEYNNIDLVLWVECILILLLKVE